MIFEQFAVGPLRCNCTILGDEESGEAIVVDGGDEPERIAAVLELHGLRARYLVHTHAHIDHIGALADLKELTRAEGALHPDDLPIYRQMALQASWLGIAPPRVAAIDRAIADGDVVRAGSLSLEVIHTPGHTPGSCCFLFEQDGERLAFTGDTLFFGSIGRTDLPGGDTARILASLRDRVLALPEETVVHPGHGPQTTIARERACNPFLQAL
ncbi:MAG TPA: MBL fold metallo-hydrolase [Candidatus Dormibacteraeota bacterium]|nr:MBL fold metallo-hydrolase [Candidatus Dormibacteraeota bacterium]